MQSRRHTLVSVLATVMMVLATVLLAAWSAPTSLDRQPVGSAVFTVPQEH